MKTMIEQTRFRFSGINVGSVAAGTRIEILVSPLAAGKKIIVRDLSVEFSSGTGVTMRPRLFESSVGVDETITQRHKGAVVAKGTLSEDTAVNAVIQLDGAGKFYLAPSPDAAADNVFSYCGHYELCDPRS